MKNIVFLAVLLVAAFTTSCDKKESDMTKPVITLNSPKEGETLAPGEVHFDMDLSDDVALKSYKIDIHFDCGHEHKSKSESHEGSEEFSFSKTYEVSGKNIHIHHHDIVIPDHAKHGEYHLMVYCTDAATNETHIARNIMIDEHGDHDHEHDHEH